MLKQIVWLTMVLAGSALADSVRIERLAGNPLLTVGDGPGLEENINGPSVIRVPDWVDDPLGRYYLYFAHHQGKYIRLAYADHPEGPFKVYAPGTLRLEDSGFPVTMPAPETLPADRRQSVEAGVPVPLYAHIASPDVHVVDEHREIRMYYHGQHENGYQLTRLAVSRDGLSFEARDEVLGRPYFRVFERPDAWYALGMPGVLYRSDDGVGDFVEGPTLFSRDMRHSALMVRGDTLHVFYTRAGDAPELILHTTIGMTGEWRAWQAGETREVLRATLPWEGADLPVAPSARGAVLEPVNQLRDPAILDLGDRVLLYYAIQGEHGIGVAQVHLTP